MRKNLYIAVIMAGMSTVSVLANTSFAEVSTSIVKNEISDKVLTDAVIAQYMVNKNAKGLNINVVAQKGVVTLIGNVPTEEVQEELEKIAKDTTGVRKVISKLIVNSPEKNNLIITNKVKSNLLKENTVKSLDIRINTKDGVVTLTGEVPTSDSKELIENLVKNTEGVEVVNSELEVNSRLEVK